VLADVRDEPGRERHGATARGRLRERLKRRVAADLGNGADHRQPRGAEVQGVGPQPRDFTPAEPRAGRGRHHTRYRSGTAGRSAVRRSARLMIRSSGSLQRIRRTRTSPAGLKATSGSGRPSAGRRWQAVKPDPRWRAAPGAERGDPLLQPDVINLPERHVTPPGQHVRLHDRPILGDSGPLRVPRRHQASSVLLEQHPASVRDTNVPRLLVLSTSARNAAASFLTRTSWTAACPPGRESTRGPPGSCRRGPRAVTACSSPPSWWRPAGRGSGCGEPASDGRRGPPGSARRGRVVGDATSNAEQGAVGPAHARARDTSLEYGELVAQDQDLDLGGGVRSRPEHDPALELGEHRVDQPQHHQRIMPGRLPPRTDGQLTGCAHGFGHPQARRISGLVVAEQAAHHGG
jgi:hypothetical protein